MKILQIAAYGAAVIFFAVGTTYFLNPKFFEHDYWFPGPSESDYECVRYRLQASLVNKPTKDIDCNELGDAVLLYYDDPNMRYSIKRSLKIVDSSKVYNVTRRLDAPIPGLNLSGKAPEFYHVDGLNVDFRYNGDEYFTTPDNVMVQCGNKVISAFQYWNLFKIRSHYESICDPVDQ